MKILIITHGLLAEGLVNSVELIIGKQDNIKYLSLTSDKNINDFKNEVEKEIVSCSENVLCLTDIVNGSPFNIISELTIKYSNVYHVSGVNLPMVLEASLSTDSLNEKFLNELIDLGQTSIFDVGAYLKEKLYEEF